MLRCGGGNTTSFVFWRSCSRKESELAATVTTRNQRLPATPPFIARVAAGGNVASPASSAPRQFSPTVQQLLDDKQINRAMAFEMMDWKPEDPTVASPVSTPQRFSPTVQELLDNKEITRAMAFEMMGWKKDKELVSTLSNVRENLIEPPSSIVTPAPPLPAWVQRATDPVPGFLRRFETRASFLRQKVGSTYLQSCDKENLLMDKPNASAYFPEVKQKKGTQVRVAVGVNTGGPLTTYRMAMQKKYFMDHFQGRSLIYGDAEHLALNVETAPSKYYCTRASKFAPAFASDQLKNMKLWVARGRCTQMRFLYLFLDLVKRFPDMDYYAILDDDLWLGPIALEQFLQTLNPDVPTMVGNPDAWGRCHMVWGGALIFTKAMAQILTQENRLMQCASSFEFSHMKGCYPSSGAFDSRKCVIDTTQHFVQCSSVLEKHCPTKNYNASGFAACAHRLEAVHKAKGCNFTLTVPEVGAAVWFDHTTWDKHRGDDHIFSWCTHAIHGAHLKLSANMKWAGVSDITCIKDTQNAEEYAAREELYFGKVTKRWVKPCSCDEFRKLISVHNVGPDDAELIQSKVKACVAKPDLRVPP